MINKERALWIYTKMHEIRDFEERVYRLFEENKLRGSMTCPPSHGYRGTELDSWALGFRTKAFSPHTFYFPSGGPRNVSAEGMTF